MIEQLVAVLLNVWHRLVPWVVVDQELTGFVRRFGRYRRDLAPGLRFICPMVEQAELVDTREIVAMLEAQSLEAADRVACVVRLKMTYRVADARVYYAAAQEGIDNIQDVAMGELGTAVTQSAWAEVASGAVLGDVRKRTRAKARKWGIVVVDLRFVDCARARSLRLWQTQTAYDAAE